MRKQYSGWKGHWLKYNGVEVPLKMEGIGNGSDGYVEIDIPSVTIKVHNFHDGSRIAPNINAVQGIDGNITGTATLNEVNLDDYVVAIQKEFGITD
jgi:hypothetical protein